jgi:hypothetical protein
MLRHQDYWIGPDGERRDELYAVRLTLAIRDAAAETCHLVDQLLQAYAAARGPLPLHRNGTHVASGWRPPEVNAATPGASRTSLHMTGQAIDIFDPDGALDAWLMSAPGQAALVRIGLWLEHPDKTPRWAHLQTVPPASKRRVFWP